MLWPIFNPSIAALFSQSASVTVANSAVKSHLDGAGLGSLIPANSLKIGDTLEFWAQGFHSTVANPNITVEIDFNNAAKLTTGIVVSGNSTNTLWEMRGALAIRSLGVGGTMIGQGDYREYGGGPNFFAMLNLATASIDTTINQTIGFFVTWGTASASDTITCTNFRVTKLSPNG